ncbi:MAG: hypothetical protein ACI835_000752 [Planctomycetota bacterium]|jgi:hypothetical protein
MQAQVPERTRALEPLQAKRYHGKIAIRSRAFFA